jgi:hypothetical protein
MLCLAAATKSSVAYRYQKRTYQVCVMCGRDLEYSWEMMHPVRSRVAANSYAPLNTVRQVETSAT